MLCSISIISEHTVGINIDVVRCDSNKFPLPILESEHPASCISIGRGPFQWEGTAAGRIVEVGRIKLAVGCASIPNIVRGPSFSGKCPVIAEAVSNSTVTHESDLVSEVERGLCDHCWINIRNRLAESQESEVLT